MPVMFKTFDPEPLFGEDYNNLRKFLVNLNSRNYTFGRWDWMITHSYLDKSGLPRIGLWIENGDIVAAATYDCSLGKAYLPVDPGHKYLYKEMLAYAERALSADGKLNVLINDGDPEAQNAAASCGFFPSQDKEHDAIYPIDTKKISYTLPEGFRITSMGEKLDLYEYGRVLWKGFNHEADGEGEFIFRPEDLPKWEQEFLRPNVDPDIKIAVAAPDGHFVSYCGMWFDPGCDTALVEPVATDPAYRRMGLGKAAVLEGVRRCGELGAKFAVVGSSQQFYYNIGFRPYGNSTFWKRK